MKNNLILVIFVSMVAFSGLIGCDNTQSSSIEEAIYAIEHQPDYKDLIQIATIHSGVSFVTPKDPYVFEVIPKMEFKDRTYISYVAVYKMKDNHHKMVFLDDSRPPAIIGEKKF